MEKEPATSKKQGFYQKLEKLQINTCLKESLKEKTTSKKQRFYQKPKTLQINTCLKGIATGKNNKQKAQILPKARKNFEPIPVLKKMQKEETPSKKQRFCQKLGKASHQCLFRRNVRRKKQPEKNKTPYQNLETSKQYLLI